MTQRIDDYLTGNLDRLALSADERADADALVRAIEETRAFVDQRSAPDLTSAIMLTIRNASVRPTPRSTFLASAFDRLWTRREISFQFRPAYVVAAAAAVAIIVLMLPIARPRASSALSEARLDNGRTLLVQFRLQASDASTVRLAGSFTNWQPQYELHQSAPGIWTITLPLPLGVHDYAFVIDGQRWVPDPYAQAVDDGFGGTNSRIAILPPDHARS
jgi:AMP-activated protein kinase-like protein